MALTNQDFTIEKGASFILEFELTKDDGTSLELAKLNGYNSYELKDYSFRTQFRKSKYRGITAIYTMSTTNLLQIDEEQMGRTTDGFYVIASKPGYVRFVLTPSTTASIKYGDYFYDIEVVRGTTGNYEVTKALSGRMSIQEEATK